MKIRRIFLVENQSPKAQELAGILGRTRAEVVSCTGPEDFLSQADDSHPSCVILDFALPGMSGLDLLERMRERRLHLPAIVVSGQPTIPLTVAAMRRGALAVFETPVEPEELVKQVQKCLSDDVEAARRRRRTREIRGRLATLAEGELDVLVALLGGKGNKTIAVELGIGQRTVEARRSRIFQKLASDSLAELVRDVVVAAETDPAVGARLER